MTHAHLASPRVPTSAMHARPPGGMLQQLLAAEDDAAAHRDTVLSLVRANGFDAMGYGRLRGDNRGAWSWHAQACYGEATFAPVEDVASDVRLGPALRSCLPVFWSDDDVRGTHPSGATLALAGPGAGERSVVVLLSRRRHSGRDIDDAAFGRVLVLGLGVHDHHTRHRTTVADRRPASPALTDLSERQQDVLRCLAGGLADKQIADRLDMSLHAVDYHMRQLRKRFGARNRVQLTQLSPAVVATPAPSSG